MEARARTVLAAGLVALAAPLAACGGQNPVEGASPERGRALIDHFGCGACHRIDGIATANGRVGPPLTDFKSDHSIAGRLPNNPAAVARWIRNPQKIKPGSDMPELGVSPQQAKAIAAYLYTQ